MVEDKVCNRKQKPVIAAGDSTPKPDSAKMAANSHGESTAGLRSRPRTRKRTASKEESSTDSAYNSSDDDEPDLTAGDHAALRWYFAIVTLLVGVTVGCLMGYAFSMHIATLHENKMWFSNIMVSIHFDSKTLLLLVHYSQKLL